MEENEIITDEEIVEAPTEPTENPNTPPDSEEDELDALTGEFPELSGLSSLEDMRSYDRYRELCDMGLTPREAYLATSPKKAVSGGKSHLRGTPIGNGTRGVGGISHAELQLAREIFGNLTDAEIRKLYRKVTK